MARFELENLPSRYVGRLIGSIGATTASPIITISPVIKRQVDNVAENDVLITEIPLLFVDPSDETVIEEGWCTGGVDNGDGTESFTVTYRGQLNCNATNPPAASFTRNRKAFPNNAIVLVDPTWLLRELKTQFLQGSDTATAIVTDQNVTVNAGGTPLEATATGVKPFAGGGEVVGVAQTATLIGASITYQKINRGTITGLTGHSGVFGKLAYADYTGATDATIKASTESPSANSKIIGVFINDTTVYLYSRDKGLTKQTAAQARAGTDDAAYASSLGVFQGIQTGLPNYAVDSVGTDSYAITVAPAISNTELAAGMRFWFKARTANTGAATLSVGTSSAKNIKKYVGAAIADLETGDILENQLVEVIYDGTQYVMLSATAQTYVKPATLAAKSMVFANSGTATASGGSDVAITNFSEVVDNGGDFASNEFTAPRTGKYVAILSGVATGSVSFKIKANGVERVSHLATNTLSATVHTLAALTAGQKFQFYIAGGTSAASCTVTIFEL